MPSGSITTDLRQRRRAVGLSQRELAARVGVSRQALVAIEGGRQVPSTTLALHLARALRCRVEDLFGLADGAAVLRAAVANADLPPRVTIGQVDGVWVAHPMADDALAADGLVVGAADASGTAAVELLADPARLADNVLVAGCAPLLGVLTGRVGRRYEARATWVRAHSGQALSLLEAGLVHVAGLHLVDADEPGGHAAIVRDRFRGQAMALVNLTRWRQGLVVAPGNPLQIRTVEDVLRPEVRLACRQPGSGARALLQARLAASGLALDDPSIEASIEASSHAEVVRLVRWGVADVGVAIGAAALAEGLDFVPLSEERFDLLVPLARVDAAPVARLLGLVDQPVFRSEAARLPGYDLSIAGHAATVPAG